MAKAGLGPLGSGEGPKGLTEVRPKMPTGQSLVDLSDVPNEVESVAGDARFVGNRYVSRLLAEANHHGEIAGVTSKVWTTQSNVVSPDSLPNRGTEDFHGIPIGPTIGPRTNANTLGSKYTASLEE
jgi:hypothetical protein